MNRQEPDPVLMKSFAKAIANGQAAMVMAMEQRRVYLGGIRDLQYSDECKERIRVAGFQAWASHYAVIGEPCVALYRWDEHDGATLTGRDTWPEAANAAEAEERRRSGVALAGV